MNAKKAKRAYFLISISIIVIAVGYVTLNYTVNRAVDTPRTQDPLSSKNITVIKEDAHSLEWTGRGSGWITVDIPSDSTVNVTLVATREGRLTLLHAPADAFAWKDGAQITLEVTVNSGLLVFAFTSDAFDASYVATATWRGLQ